MSKPHYPPGHGKLCLCSECCAKGLNARTDKELEGYERAFKEKQPPNPKTLMGNLKVPNLSVVPFTGLIEEARAMQYGAYHAPRKDGSKGYGPFNWRDQDIEYMTYVEAAIRHLASAADREDVDPETGDLKVLHLGLAKATIGILIDAIAHGTVIDNRPKTSRGVVAETLRKYRKQNA